MIKDSVDWNHENGTCLYVAVNQKQSKIVKLLLDHGATYNWDDLMVMSVKTQNPELIRLFYEKVSINLRDLLKMGLDLKSEALLIEVMKRNKLSPNQISELKKYALSANMLELYLMAGGKKLSVKELEFALRSGCFKIIQFAMKDWKEDVNLDFSLKLLLINQKISIPTKMNIFNVLIANKHVKLKNKKYYEEILKKK